MKHQELLRWVKKTLEEFPADDIFMVSMDWNSSTQKMVVYVDSDEDLPLEKCQAISRHIERALDTSGIIGLSYTLEVSSPGLDRPLTHERQFTKNIGRIVRMKLVGDTERVGRLTAYENGTLTLEPEKRFGKKGQVKYGDPIKIDLDDVVETFVEIRF